VGRASGGVLQSIWTEAGQLNGLLLAEFLDYSSVGLHLALKQLNSAFMAELNKSFIDNQVLSCKWRSRSLVSTLQGSTRIFSVKTWKHRDLHQKPYKFKFSPSEHTCAHMRVCVYVCVGGLIAGLEIFINTALYWPQVVSFAATLSVLVSAHMERVSLTKTQSQAALCGSGLTETSWGEIKYFLLYLKRAECRLQENRKPTGMSTRKFS
jgi:hypothetical protein